MFKAFIYCVVFSPKLLDRISVFKQQCICTVFVFLLSFDVV